jgi:virginiamycin B lyase
MALATSYFPLGGPYSTPTSIVTGPDGNIWFTVSNPSSSTGQISQIGEVNVSTGVVSEYPTKTGQDTLGTIISGPGGDLWFIEDAGLGSINPTTHVITQYSLGIANAGPAGLAEGADGKIWFTDPNNAAVGVFNPTTGTASEFAMPKTTDLPFHIIAGPDGNLWFTVGDLVRYEQGGAGPGSIGKINPTTHAISLFATQGVASGITVGPDGNIWFNDSATVSNGLQPPTTNVRIGDVVPSTGVLTEYMGSGGAGSIVSGPGGDLWYQGYLFGSQLESFDPVTHLATESDVPTKSTTVIASGPGGTLWYGSFGTTSNGSTEGYIVSASVIPATQSSIGGYVYYDPTGNGTTANGPLANATVFLDLKNDGQLDPGDPIANATTFGYYSFNGLAPGTYTVRLVPYPGNIVTFPNNSSQTITVTGGQIGSALQLGLLPTSTLIPLTYDLSPFGSNNPDVQTAEVIGLYKLILNRAPDAAGGAAAVNYLKTGGSVTQVAANLLNSAEYETGVIASYYQTYLRRTGSSAEIASWVNLMQHGLTEERAAAAFLSSAEYSLLFPTNASFVQALYGDVLGRLPASSEVAGWVNLLNKGVTRSQVASAFISSTESDLRNAMGLYGIIFARPAHPADQTAVVSALQAGVTLVQLSTGLFGSAEFASRANATVG